MHGDLLFRMFQTGFEVIIKHFTCACVVAELLGVQNRKLQSILVMETNGGWIMVFHMVGNYIFWLTVDKN